MKRTWNAVSTVSGVAVATVALTTVALAESADEAFERGNALAKQGKLAEAEQAYEVAWGQRESWDIAGNLGFMEAEQGKWTEAAGHLDYAVRHMGGLAKPKQREKLEQRLTEAKTHVGWLEIACTPGSELKSNDAPLGTCPVEAPPYLAPGKYAVSSGMKGYSDARVNVDVVAGKGASVDLRLELLAVPTASSSASAPPSATPTPPRRPLWPVGVGFAAAGVGAGVAIGLTVAANGIDTSTACAVDCDAQKSRQNDLSNGALWSFVVAGGFAAATTGYLIWAVTGPEVKKETEAIGIVPVVSPALNGVLLQGSF